MKNFLFELVNHLILPGSILFSIPFGVRYWFRAVFGYGKIPSAIGIAIGIALGFIAFLSYNHYEKLDKVYEDEYRAHKKMEHILMNTENDLTRALNLMSEEQRTEFYRLQR